MCLNVVNNATYSETLADFAIIILQAFQMNYLFLYLKKNQNLTVYKYF